MSRFILIILFFSNISQGQGLKLPSVEDLNKVSSLKYDDQFGLTGSVPEFYSLEKYVPSIKDQGSSNACTGFAIFYYGLSTQLNASFDISNTIDKNGHSFDPYFGYNIINDNNYEYSEECDATNTLDEVLDILKTRGAKKQFYTPHIDCNSSSDALLDLESYVKPYSIYNYFEIPGIGSNTSVNSTKQQLLKKNPVMLGVWFPNNFLQPLKGSIIQQNNGEYRPNDIHTNQIKNTFKKYKNKTISEDEIEIFLNNYFGHAVTIVGFNDNINGGSFRVVNSWGENWGDDGYFWLSYDDFKKMTLSAYVLELSNDILPENEFQFDSNNYVRVISDQDDSSYEGQYLNNMANGQGIYSYTTDQGKVNLIGNWKNDTMDGFFTIINSDNEIYYGNYKNGEYIESFGFTDDETTKNQEKFREYWEKYGGDKKIKKSKNIIVKVKKVIKS